MSFLATFPDGCGCWALPSASGGLGEVGLVCPHTAAVLLTCWAPLTEVTHSGNAVVAEMETKPSVAQRGRCSCRGSRAGAGAGCVPLALACPARSHLSRSQHGESCGEEAFRLVIFLERTEPAPAAQPGAVPVAGARAGRGQREQPGPRQGGMWRRRRGAESCVALSAADVYCTGWAGWKVDAASGALSLAA